MQRGAYSTLASIELLDHAFYLVAKASLIEVETKDVLAAVKLLQRAPVLIGLANL